MSLVGSFLCPLNLANLPLYSFRRPTRVAAGLAVVSAATICVVQTACLFVPNGPRTLNDQKKLRALLYRLGAAATEQKRDATTVLAGLTS